MEVIQVLDALDYGDGVSNDVIDKSLLIKELGYTTAIYSKYCDDRVAYARKDIKELQTNTDDIIIHHYSGYSNIIDAIRKCNCKKIFVYHNITPPEFLDGEAKKSCEKGLKQLNEIKGFYDYFVGVSDYNVSCLKDMKICKEADVLPIMVDFGDKDTVKKIKKNDITKFLFVGRIAQNKKIEDVIDLFDYYYNNIDCNSKLFFIGNDQYFSDYTTMLLDRVKALSSRNNIVFTGKISDELLTKHYQEADVFVCMSEHEGFCIPVLEGMFYKIPVFAYDAGAISFTMGDSGVLIKSKQYDEISKLIYLVLSNKNLKDKILEAQDTNLLRFSKNSVKEKLSELIVKWSK